MASKFSLPALSLPLLIITTVLFFADPTAAFGAGYVSRGSHLKATNFRHGDIALAIPLFATANRRLVKQIYFGNWLRDFSQLLDRTSLSLVPRPVLRALVAIFAFVQFGYATGEFEVTDERLGFYRPEEHVDNPRGYDGSSAREASATSQGGGQVLQALSEGLRPPVQSTELAIDAKTGMKNYIANSIEVGAINPTSADYVEKQLIAAIACGRQGDEEAYIHLGAAMHTLEDFAAHSNYVELTLQMIGAEMKKQANVTPALSKVFAYVGGAAKVGTARGAASPITTGTFGMLDLYQTLLGEIDDKLAAMSLPGVKARMPEKSGVLQTLSKSLIGLLGGLTPSFEKGILQVGKAATSGQSITWGELETKPERLWESLEPVFRLRDNIVKWVYDHLTVRAVQDALAAISDAIDKLVYMVLGIFLGPLLSEFSKVLKDQEQELLIRDQGVRLASGESSIFHGNSIADDPTHSQLAKDHYDNELNEIAGRVAVRISSYTTTKIIQLWQPGNIMDPLPAIASILQAFHNPFNSSPNSAVQALMYNEVYDYVTNQLTTNTKAFEEKLHALTAPVIAARVNEHASLPQGHSLVDAMTALHAPHSIAPQTVHDLVTKQQPEVQRAFMQRVSDNVEQQLQKGSIKGVGMKDFPAIKKLLFAPPGAEAPNPLDAGLAKIPGIGYIDTFEGISISELAAADGMGETLKDAVVSLILLDESRGVKEEEIAASRFGWGRTEAEKEERRRLRELRRLLKIEKSTTQLREGQFDEKKGAGEKMKEKFEKLKLKAGGDH